MPIDEGWKHAQPLGKCGSMCNYCGKELKSGGVTRLKNHLIGESGRDVEKCPKCPPEVKKKFKAQMRNKGQEKKIKKIAIEKTRKKLRRIGKNSSDKEGGSDNKVQMHRRLLDTAAEEKWNLDQVARERLHCRQVGVGTSGNVDSGTKKKSGQGLLNIRGQSYSTRRLTDDEVRHYKIDAALQPSINHPTLRETLGISILKFFIQNHIPANVAADHHFLNMIDVAQCVGCGVLPPTPKEISGKYFDMYVAEIRIQLHHDDPASDVKYSSESNSSSYGGDDDDGDNDNGEDDENGDSPQLQMQTSNALQLESTMEQQKQHRFQAQEGIPEASSMPIYSTAQTGHNVPYVQEVPYQKGHQLLPHMSGMSFSGMPQQVPLQISHQKNLDNRMQLTAEQRSGLSSTPMPLSTNMAVSHEPQLGFVQNLDQIDGDTVVSSPPNAIASMQTCVNEQIEQHCIHPQSNLNKEMHQQQELPKQRLHQKLHKQQMSQVHWRSYEVSDMSMFLDLDFEVSQMSPQCDQNGSQRLYLQQPLKATGPYTNSAELLQPRSSHISQHSPPQTDLQNLHNSFTKTGTPTHTANTPFIPLTDPSPISEDPEKITPGVSSISNADNVRSIQMELSPGQPQTPSQGVEP